MDNLCKNVLSTKLNLFVIKKDLEKAFHGNKGQITGDQLISQII